MLISGSTHGYARDGSLQAALSSSGDHSTLVLASRNPITNSYIVFCGIGGTHIEVIVE